MLFGTAKRISFLPSDSKNLKLHIPINNTNTYTYLGQFLTLSNYQISVYPRKQKVSLKNNEVKENLLVLLGRVIMQLYNLL